MSVITEEIKLGKSVQSRKLKKSALKLIIFHSLLEFLVGRNIFVNLPTGYSKSLVFHYLPITQDASFERSRESWFLGSSSVQYRREYVRLRLFLLDVGAS